jgi:hypothetical protein
MFYFDWSVAFVGLGLFEPLDDTVESSSSGHLRRLRRAINWFMQY